MSAGERSCKKYGYCKLDRLHVECNVTCHEYEWDGETPPDTSVTMVGGCRLEIGRLQAEKRRQALSLDDAPSEED